MFGGTKFDDPQIAADVRGAQERAQKHQRYARLMAEIQGTGRSKDGEITACVDGSGAVLSLRLSDRVTDRGGRRAAADILDTIARARANFQDQALAQARDLLGEDDPAFDMLSSEIAAQRAASHPDSTTAEGAGPGLGHDRGLGLGHRETSDHRGSGLSNSGAGSRRGLGGATDSDPRPPGSGSGWQAGGRRER
ncbi:YbaB/EbfC family nucleoid-associated protein [Mycetocola saprophilus]|uniref:YbaB/EbfC family nucleoid-associated protein n=1 Tax=Mycetocola saprophilus TaxID=76636 RepID=UPI003BEFF15C